MSLDCAECLASIEYCNRKISRKNTTCCRKCEYSGTTHGLTEKNVTDTQDIQDDGRYIQDPYTDEYTDPAVFAMLTATALLGVLAMRIFYVVGRRIIRIITR